MDFGFGIPKQRVNTRKVEKFNFPVMTLEEFKGKGYSRRISFNKAAVIALGFDKDKKDEKLADQLSVSFGFKGQMIFLANTSGTGEPTAIRYNKTSDDLANKELYNYITKILDLDQTVVNEFALTDTGESSFGKALFSATPLTMDQLALARTVDTETEEVLAQNTSEGEAVSVGVPAQANTVPVAETDAFVTNTADVQVPAPTAVAPSEPEFDPSTFNVDPATMPADSNADSFGDIGGFQDTTETFTDDSFGFGAN